MAAFARFQRRLDPRCEGPVPTRAAVCRHGRPRSCRRSSICWPRKRRGVSLLILGNCLPHGMPSWMLITHNAFEILITPGRVTLLGEVDGNRMRQIYTDGRPHPEDPDLTLHGHSIRALGGRRSWSTSDRCRATKRPVSATISEAAGVPNNGDMQDEGNIFTS